jgi:hypothetical protein
MLLNTEQTGRAELLRFFDCVYLEATVELQKAVFFFGRLRCSVGSSVICMCILLCPIEGICNSAVYCVFLSGRCFSHCRLLD